MTWFNWIPAISTSGVIAIILWLFRNVIITRLTKSVEHEFNIKIETLRTELRQGEERLRADLRAKEAEIAALRSGAMTALVSRQVAVDKRRLEAVDQLWAAARSLGHARRISSIMSVIKFEAAAEHAEHDPKLREFFEKLGLGFDIKSIDVSESDKARPYVSLMAWATFSAIHAVSMHAVIRWHILKSGLGNKDFSKTESINKLLKTALPHQATYVDTHGSDGYHFLLEELDTKLLSELRAMLAGGEADKVNLEQAAEILKQSNELFKPTRPETVVAQVSVPVDPISSRAAGST